MYARWAVKNVSLRIVKITEHEYSPSKATKKHRIKGIERVGGLLMEYNGPELFLLREHGVGVDGELGMGVTSRVA
jgi:hypothetical protein